MRSELDPVATGSRETVHDITRECAEIRPTQGEDGLLHVFVPHATAGVALIELGSGSDDDLLSALRELLPADDRWRHAHGSAGHGRSHVMPAFIPPYATIPVLGGGWPWARGNRSPSWTSMSTTGNARFGCRFCRIDSWRESRPYPWRPLTTEGHSVWTVPKR